jgi:hypothetical protein
MDFIKLDYRNGRLLSAQASRSKAKELRLVAEAIRLGMYEPLF